MNVADRELLSELITTSVLRPDRIRQGLAIIESEGSDADVRIQEPSSGDYKAFHEVLRKVRGELGSGSDLDILYRIGYWEAVKDHTKALATCESLREAMRQMAKPTVPMAMLKSFISEFGRGVLEDSRDFAVRIADRYGYEVVG